MSRARCSATRFGFSASCWCLLDAATHAALTHALRAVRVRFGLQGKVGVVRVLVGDVSAAGALPEVSPGTIALGIAESDAGAAYMLVLPALGAGA